MLLLLLACSGEEAVVPVEVVPEPVRVVEDIQLRLPDHEVFTPYPTPLSPDLAKTLEVLGEVVDKHAGDPANPWAIAHGMLARGPGFVLTNGEPALPWLYANYASISEIEGVEYPAFPRSMPDGTKVEPHTDLLLKVFTESGVDPSTVVLVDGREFEVADTWRHSLKTTFISVGPQGESTSFDSTNDMPWGVQSLAMWAPEDLQWKAFEGTEMDMDDTTKLMVHILTSENDFIVKSMLSGVPFQKEKQGIHMYTCGGAHLLQGAAFAVARGYGTTEDLDKMKVNGKVLYYRYAIEVDIVNQTMKKHPTYRLQLLSQQLKFIGHFIESAHKLAALGVYLPDATEQATLLTATDDLIGVVKELKALGAFDNLDEIRPENEQLYLDLVGDSSHAVNAIEIATGKRAVRY